MDETGKSLECLAEYWEGGKKQKELTPIAYDDQIDLHNWLRDTPVEWLIATLKGIK